jgi:hypothetical protein
VNCVSVTLSSTSLSIRSDVLPSAYRRLSRRKCDDLPLLLVTCVERSKPILDSFCLCLVYVLLISPHLDWPHLSHSYCSIYRIHYLAHRTTYTPHMNHLCYASYATHLPRAPAHSPFTLRYTLIHLLIPPYHHTPTHTLHRTNTLTHTRTLTRTRTCRSNGWLTRTGPSGPN